VESLFVEAGFLVYKPHRAFSGRWNERFQGVNDHVLGLVDAVVYMTPDGIPALGTDHEVAYAKSLGKPIFHLPPVSLSALWPFSTDDRIEETIGKVSQALDVEHLPINVR
jgi:hypothetical protein